VKRILSIDGGGLRGAIPCAVLVQVEKLTGKPAAQSFDLMAGTSTGAILVACLKKGIPAETILELYKTKAKTIFNRAWFSFLDHFALFASKYSEVGVESVLLSYLGNTTIGSDEPRILIPALDFQTGRPKFFKTEKDKDVKLAYAARASAAAPTYFPPKDGLIDGGMFANDPAMCALAEAYKLWGDKDLHMLSLGTGYTPIKSKPTRGGLLDWATVITDVFMTGEMGCSAYQTSYCMEDGHYIRLQGVLPSNINPALDNTDPTNISRLIDFGNKLYKENEDKIKGLLL